MVKSVKRYLKRLFWRLKKSHSRKKLADTIALNILPGVEKKQELLETLDVEMRIKKLIEYTGEELNISKISAEISQRTKATARKAAKGRLFKRADESDTKCSWRGR